MTFLRCDTPRSRGATSRNAAVLTVVSMAAALAAIPKATLSAQQDVAAERPAAAEAGTDLLARPVTIKLEHMPLRQAVLAVATAAHVQIQYRGKLLDATDAVVTMQATQRPLGEVFTQMLAGTHLQAVAIANDMIGIEPTMAAQKGQGIVVGTVTDASNKRPIAGAIVRIEPLDRAVRTGENGTYRMTGVAAGSYQLQIRRLGYSSGTRRVEVQDDHTVTVDVALAPAATVLDELVTTATGDQKRLEIGNSIGTINADSVVQTTLIRNMSDLLQARTPGVVVSNTSGAVGAPSKIRIRGIGSISLNNDPIVIVDGVRLNAVSSTASSQTNTGASATGGSTVIINSSTSGQRRLPPSRLDDIDPNTIESIDVLKGPSAANLYGSEAANGVIVIKTKRAAVGRFRTNVLADQGLSTRPGPAAPLWFGWGHKLDGTVISTCMLAFGSALSAPNVSDGSCVQDSVTSFNPQNNPDLTTIGTGSSRDLSANVSGGTEQLRQFLSARVSNATGMSKLSNAESRRLLRMRGSEPPSWMRRPNGEQDIDGTTRTDFHTSLADVFVSANAVYRNVLQGSGSVPDPGIASIVSPGSSFLIPYAPDDTLRYLPGETQAARRTNVSKRGYLVTGGNLMPWHWLSLRGNVGGDYTLDTGDELQRAIDCTTQLTPNCVSAHSSDRGETFQTTVDVGSTLNFQPLSWLSARTALGEQYTDLQYYDLAAQNYLNTTLSFGSNLLSPSPIGASSTTQLYNVTEARDEGATAGWYAEQTLGVRERLFLTAGFRQDAASAFGTQTNKSSLPVFPKYSLSWLVSQEPFFPSVPTVTSFRLRTAYGHSGTQASQRDVLQNFSQTTVLLNGSTTAAPGIVLSSIGNPDLKPERTTEWEGGFDLSLFEGERVHLEWTAYRKLSRDAIETLSLPYSFGTMSSTNSSSLSQKANIGSVKNTGTELLLTARIIDAQPLSWDITVYRSANSNMLVKKSASVAAGSNTTGQFRQGYPIFGYWGKQLLSYADANGDGILSPNEVVFSDTDVFQGAPYPHSELTYGNTLTLLNGMLRFAATVDEVQGLATQINTTPSTGTPSRYGTRCSFDRTCSLAQQAIAMQAMTGTAGGGGYIHQSSAVRLNELSVTYNIPTVWTQRLLRGSSASVTLAGRNLALWTNYPGADPDVNTQSTLNDVTTDNGLGLSQPRNWVLRLNLGF